MKEQNITNHTQIVYRYYLMTGIPILFLGGIAIWKIIDGDDRDFGWILLLISWILITMFFKGRTMALKAQDRAIRAEESLRYFILTGKRIDPRIKMSQIIALRFASDEELPSLVQKALMFLICFVVILITGPGKFSLDKLVGK